MRKKVVNKLVVNWAASFLSVLMLMSMVATPALALVVANSVNSSSIVDGSIRTRDIKRNAINSSRIRDYSIRKEDIHSGSINKYKLTSNSVNTYKIADGSVRNQDIANSAVNSTKIADGSIKNADISPGAAISDAKFSYSTKTKVLSMSSQAFMPRDESQNFTKVSNSLYMQAGSGAFSAPVYLPQGAKVTNFKVVGEDNSGGTLSGSLYRRTESVSKVMAELTTGGAVAGWRTFTDSTVIEAVIDNDNYAYFALVDFDVASSTLELDRVIITYEVSGP